MNQGYLENTNLTNLKLSGWDKFSALKFKNEKKVWYVKSLRRSLLSALECKFFKGKKLASKSSLSNRLTSCHSKSKKISFMSMKPPKENNCSGSFLNFMIRSGNCVIFRAFAIEYRYFPSASLTHGSLNYIFSLILAYDITRLCMLNGNPTSSWARLLKFWFAWICEAWMKFWRLSIPFPRNESFQCTQRIWSYHREGWESKFNLLQ